MQTPPKWRIFTTHDGSPTLIISRADGYEEKMHHTGGALTERLFIYQGALRKTLEQGWTARILSLGTGLGYNEMIAMGELLKTGAKNWKIWSFEIDSALRLSFTSWVKGESSELAVLHDDILQRVAATFELPAEELLAFARAGFQHGNLELRGAFPTDAGGVAGCTCVFYDAFSKKMDNDLWEEHALAERLSPLLAQGCILSTYGAAGSMKRALKALGFRLLPRAGFLGKRESTLAIRE